MKTHILNILSMSAWGVVLYIVTKDWDMNAPISTANALWLMAWALTWIAITRK